ncbi:endophilin-A-like isoform X2 [Lineus longissimus]|uniref:endophilin-A-like isoform X2 n=1 Tax=Lineus longissimus TaxID=88925 RepID=UPI00315D4DE3
MTFAGFKKQINKANQYVSEKIGGAKGTELDDEFVEMERKFDVTAKFVEDVQGKTHEYLQPNPATRTKMMLVSKLKGQSNKTALYPQPEGTLGECMSKHGTDLGDDSYLGMALMEAGDTYKQIAEYKYSLEDSVKQNFLEPLHQLQSKDFREVQHHRKKLNSRRLDFDCKKRKQTKAIKKGNGSAVSEEEIRLAEEKFEESRKLAWIAMKNVLENDVEQITQLSELVDALVDYHTNCAEALRRLQESLKEKVGEAAARPKAELPARLNSSKGLSPYNNDDIDNGSTYSVSPMPSPAHQPHSSFQNPCARALYDFDPENEGELGFEQGEIINLTNRIDENWLEGEIHGKTGYFPENYVDIITDLP